MISFHQSTLLDSHLHLGYISILYLKLPIVLYKEYLNQTYLGSGLALLAVCPSASQQISLPSFLPC